MKNNEISLLNIFYSNSPLGIDYQAIGELDYLVEKKLLKVKSGQLCDISKLHVIIDKLKNGSIKTIDYEGGGIKHMALKNLGKDLLLSLGLKAKIESQFYNRYPDVISEDLSVIVECGDTDPNKILEYFTNDIAKIVIIPYPDSEEVIYYEFSPVAIDELHEYIENRNNYNLNKIKQIINRRDSLI